MEKYITLTERQRFTQGYEAQGSRDIKYSKREMDIVTAFNTFYKRKEIYAHWFATRSIGKRAPRQCALKTGRLNLRARRVDTV